MLSWLSKLVQANSFPSFFVFVYQSWCKLMSHWPTCFFVSVVRFPHWASVMFFMPQQTTWEQKFAFSTCELTSTNRLAWVKQTILTKTDANKMNSHQWTDLLVCRTSWQSQRKRTHINEEVGSCEVDHPSRHQEEEDCGFEDNPTPIEGSEGGQQPLVAFASPVFHQLLCVFHFGKLTPLGCFRTSDSCHYRPHVTTDNK